MSNIKKGKGNKNIQEILEWHIKSKRFIGGLCKIEKDGTMRKINGQVFSKKTTKSGLEAVIIDNLLGQLRKGDTKRWQMILTKNIVKLNENKWKHEKID